MSSKICIGITTNLNLYSKYNQADEVTLQIDTLKEVLYRMERQIITLSLQVVRHAGIADTQRKIRSNCLNTKTAMVDFNLLDMLRTVTRHIEYNVGEAFVILRWM